MIIRDGCSIVIGTYSEYYKKIEILFGSFKTETMSTYKTSGLDKGTHLVSNKMITDSEIEDSSSMLSTPTRKRKYKQIESPTTQLVRNMFETIIEFKDSVANIYV